MQQSALLLLDCQNDFFDPPVGLDRVGMIGVLAEDRVAVVNNLKILLEVARRTNKPIFHLRTAFRRDLADCLFTPLWKKRLRLDIPFLIEGSHGASFIQETAVDASDFVITKKAHSAFQFTPLDRMLSDLDIRTCIVAGFGGVFGSVDDTIRQGAALGYDIVVIPDAVFPLDISYVTALKNRASVRNTKEIVEQLTRMPAAPKQVRNYKPALIVVDMQNDSIHPDGCNQRLGFSHLTDEDRNLIIANNQRLGKFMREKGWPIIYVNLAHRLDLSDSASPKMVHRNKPLPNGIGRRSEGTWGAETVAELRPNQSDYVLVKKGQSAFGFTPLHRLLRNLEVDACLITGGAVTGCVSDTVREGVGLGHPAVVISDATYPPNSPDLGLLAGRAEIKTTDEVLAMLREESLM